MEDKDKVDERELGGIKEEREKKETLLSESVYICR